VALFLTDYAEGEGTYGSYIEAENAGHARQLAGQRGLNERILGKIEAPALPHRLRQSIHEENWANAIHEATFLGFVGLSSGALTARDLLGDHGLIHELIHLARPFKHHPDEAPEIVAADNADRERTKQRVAALAAQCEWRVPGWPPSGGQPGVSHFRNGEAVD
jgi:hypothetical protein